MTPSRFHKMMRDYSIARAKDIAGAARAYWLRMARQDHDRYVRTQRQERVS